MVSHVVRLTMGRRGGQKAAQRWKTEPEGKYAQEQREDLSNANKRRSAGARSQAYKIAAYFDDLSQWAESDEFFDAMDAAARSGNSDGESLRHAQEIIRRWLGK